MFQSPCDCVDARRTRIQGTVVENVPSLTSKSLWSFSKSLHVGLLEDVDFAKWPKFTCYTNTMGYGGAGLPAAGGWGGSNRTLGIEMEGFTQEDIAKAVDHCDNDRIKSNRLPLNLATACAEVWQRRVFAKWAKTPRLGTSSYALM